MVPNSRCEGGRRTRGVERTSTPEKPLVTVITVVFNGARTIEQTILSVLAQTYENVEYLVIDGGSTDGSLDILRQYEDRIDYWQSEKDRGLYDAMNKGIALAKGDVVGMLNADDFFAAPSALADIVDGFAEGVDAVFSCLDIVDPTDLARVVRKYRISSFSRFMLRIGVMPPHPTFYCRKSCFEKAGGYRTDYQIAADFEMLARLLLKHDIKWKFLDKTTVNMRSGGVSSSGIKAHWTLNLEIIRACKENGLYTNLFVLALKLPIRLFECVR